MQVDCARNLKNCALRPMIVTLRLERNDDIEADVTERPRQVRVRAKVTKGEKKSRWGDVVRVDRLGLC